MNDEKKRNTVTALADVENKETNENLDLEGGEGDEI